MGSSRTKHSSSSFSLLGLFKSKKSRSKKADDLSNRAEEYVKAYKVYPSDYDIGRWVAEPGIDKKASEYISLTAHKWEKLANAN